MAPPEVRVAQLSELYTLFIAIWGLGMERSGYSSIYMYLKSVRLPHAFSLGNKQQ